MNKVIEQKQRKDLTVYVSALDVFCNHAKEL